MTTRRSFFRRFAGLVVALPFAPVLLAKLPSPKWRQVPIYCTQTRIATCTDQAYRDHMANLEWQRKFVENFFWGKAGAPRPPLTAHEQAQEYLVLKYRNPTLTIYEQLSL